MLNLTLKQEYFNAIKIGSKKIEGRIYTSKFKDLKPGMNILFTCTKTNETIMCKVIAINIYKNFTDMLQAEGVENMLPGTTLLHEGVTIYESFPNYKNKAKKNGVLAIKIEKLSKLETNN